MCKPLVVTQFVSPFIPTIHALALAMWASDRAVEHLPLVREVTDAECVASLDTAPVMPTHTLPLAVMRMADYQRRMGWREDSI